MNQPIIYFDNRSGNLLPSKVWNMDFSEVEQSPRGTAYATMTYRKGLDARRAIKDCQLDQSHVTGIEELRVGVDLFGDRLGDFVPMQDDFLPIISAAFATRLRQTRLTGYKLRPIVTVVENESRIENPELYLLEFAGKGGRSTRLVVQGASNLCPHCHKATMVCPGCGKTNWPKCINCDQWTTIIPTMPECSNPKGFIIKGYPPEVEIVEAKLWDGSDFFEACGGVPFVSNRAKEWMEKTHTFPVKFKPALLNIEGAEDKFKEK